ncbi:penicillin-binding protein 2 [Akkermansiaceae bacterium]|nr:penicillin-binding protein 2 [Akkermansiaceae bacterium]
MQKSSKNRFIVLCGLIVVGLSFLSYRLVQIQIVDRTKYAERATKSYKRQSETAHTRGMILDRNDEVIADDILEKNVYIDKYHFLNVEVAAGSLASMYLRLIFENKEDGEMKEILGGLLNKKAYSECKNWEDFSSRERQSLRTKGAKILLENLDADEITKRNVELVCREYHRPLGLTLGELKKCIDLKKKSKHVLAKKGLSYKAAKKFEELVNLNGIKGFDLRDSVRREYKEPLMATHIVGVVNHKRNGVSGIEGKLNSYLRGRDGSETRYLDPRGYSIAGEEEVLPPQHGTHVRLTIDMRLQAIVEEELEWGMDQFECQRGSVVLMDPNSGEVLAMASRPHYNLATMEGMRQAEFNFAIQAQNETGSTIKIIALAGALNENVYNYRSPVDCGWGIIRGPGLSPPVKDHHPYGTLEFWKVLQKSSNTGTYRIAKSLGQKKFYDYLEKFGYGKKTGIELVGEVSGKADRRDNEREFASSTYGYMVSASPIQIAAAYSVIANGGHYMAPRVIKDVHTRGGKVISGADMERGSPESIQVLRPEIAKLMRMALKTVTEPGGTATKAAVEGYEVGGKTGTSHRYEPGVGYKNKKGKEEYVASFAGMCPIEKPKFVCVVVMDDPKKRTQLDKDGNIIQFKPSGGSVAGPMFSRICSRVAPILGVESNYETQATR